MKDTGYISTTRLVYSQMPPGSHPLQINWETDKKTGLHTEKKKPIHLHNNVITGPTIDLYSTLPRILKVHNVKTDYYPFPSNQHEPIN